MKYRDRDWLEEQIEQKGRSLRSIADETDVSVATILRWRDKFGLGDWTPPVDEDELRRMHHDERMTLTAIAEERGSSYITIERSLHQHGIERRYYREGADNNGWSGGTDPPTQRWRRKAEYSDARQEALESANRQCEECGSAEDLHIHHITPVVDGGPKYDQTNIEVLCEGCHRTRHN